MAKDRKEQMRLWNQSDNGKKSRTIIRWKLRGLISDDYDKIYYRYINSKKCELCNKKYKNKRDRCLDHLHLTGKFRNIVCQMCNCSSKLKEINKNNTSKHKNITITKSGNYKVQISVNKLFYNKTFKTEEEAILFRDFLL